MTVYKIPVFPKTIERNKNGGGPILYVNESIPGESINTSNIKESTKIW